MDTKVGGNVKREWMLVDGEWTASVGGGFILVEIPAKRGTFITEVPRAMEADVDHAVKAAAKPFESWKRMVPRDREKLILKIASDLEAQSEDLAKTLCMEIGNAIQMANDNQKNGSK